MKARLVALVAAVLCIAGCAPSQPPPTASPSPSSDLRALREQYGVPDCPASASDAEPVEDGLPRTALPCLGSDKVVNLAGLPRKPMVINLWAQWCAPCREEAAFLREAATKHNDIAFLGINYNDPRPDWALEFASVVHWPYPHVQDMDKQLRTELNVPGIPMTLFVDPSGRVVYTHPGVLRSTEQLEQLIEEHL
ncbi:TlpA disulfide reductase family protein [uncultured Tessaracoccus sp.]|uniref:TlpA family protein disulfide reductase n=1 Tax=uncultured Tessaracoccus sp. TaxID=905023 RepID=UPI00261C51FD|nr:TlpA disulfide reductase family protein [uncultured Tessaracoccus sp.]